MINSLDIGTTFGGLKDFDVTNIVKQLLWKNNAQEFTLKISKDIDDYHIYVKIEDIKNEPI